MTEAVKKERKKKVLKVVQVEREYEIKGVKTKVRVFVLGEELQEKLKGAGIETPEFFADRASASEFLQKNPLKKKRTRKAFDVQEMMSDVTVRLRSFIESNPDDTRAKEAVQAFVADFEDLL